MNWCQIHLGPNNCTKHQAGAWGFGLKVAEYLLGEVRRWEQ